MDKKLIAKQFVMNHFFSKINFLKNDFGFDKVMLNKNLSSEFVICEEYENYDFESLKRSMNALKFEFLTSVKNL